MKKFILSSAAKLVFATLAFALISAGAAERAPVTGFGCFVNVYELGGVDNWRAHVRLMKASGMNTFAIWLRTPEDLAAQINIAIEEGMLTGDVPVFVLPEVSEEWSALNVPDWDQVVSADTEPPYGLGPGQTKAFTFALNKAKELATQISLWPELILYNLDEPKKEQWKAVGQITAAYNAFGYRSGTGCILYNGQDAKEVASLLDIVAVAVIIGGNLRDCRDAIQGAGKEFWVYHTSVPQLTPAMARWQSGYFVWQTQPKCHLSWNWNGFITGDLDDPSPTATLAGYARGVSDHRILTEAEQFVVEARSESGDLSETVLELQQVLDELRRRYDWEGMPVGPWRKDEYNAVPDIDLDALMAKIEKLMNDAH